MFFFNKKTLLIKFQKIYFRLCCKKRLPIASLIRCLADFEYVLLKVDTPYVPSKFPMDYPIGKDLDILVSKKDFNNAVCTLKEFCQSCRWSYGYDLIEEDGRVKFRFMWNESLHYQIDCCSTIGTDGLEVELLKNRRRRGGFFVPDVPSEVLLRLYELMNSPWKTHHLDYLQMNFDSIDYSLARCLNIKISAELHLSSNKPHEKDI